MQNQTHSLGLLGENCKKTYWHRHTYLGSCLGHVSIVVSFLECGEIFFILESTWWLLKCWSFIQTFAKNEKLRRFYTILSTNVAENGATFVSTMEGIQCFGCVISPVFLKWATRQCEKAHNLCLSLLLFACSTVTAKSYPFYGVQWHPEVNRFQWAPDVQFPHSPYAVRVSSLLSEFFIDEGELMGMSAMSSETN